MQGTFGQSLVKIDKMISEICVILKKTSGRGWGWPALQLLGHLICLFTLIINIYGLGVGISTLKKFTSGRGWGMTPRGLSYKAFNLPSPPDHKYIWLRGGHQLRPGVIPIHYRKFFFENYTYLWNHFVNFNQTLPKCSLHDPLPKLSSVCLGSKEGPKRGPKMINYFNI
jgi:hypothetical protein